jgi:hypothetical protein
LVDVQYYLKSFHSSFDKLQAMMNLLENCRNHHQRALLTCDGDLAFHYVEVVWVDWVDW